GDAGRRGHVHHGLQHGKPRSDGRAHGRFHRRRPGADALRPRPPDAAVVSDPDHPGARHRGRLQRPVRAGPAKLALLRDRGQPACQPLVRARVQGDRLPHRASRREGRGRQAARGDPPRDHGAHVRRLRTGPRLLRGQDPALAARSGIDRWFIDRLETIARLEVDGSVRDLRRAGFSDAMIEALRGETVEPALPTYKLVDTCAGEFEAATPYYYSCWEEEDEAAAVEGRTVEVIGSGPIRIGQGIEFDYCSVHAAWALREAGVRAVMVNSNPETVSTDFDTSDR